MKTFSIITEADARLLERGSMVALSPGGHVTPLAQDTLRERRVTVVGAVPDAATASLAPVADVRRVVVGGDHTSLSLKTEIRETLRRRGLAVTDVGTDAATPVDYPDIAARVARQVARGGSQARVGIHRGG